MTETSKITRTHARRHIKTCFWLRQGRRAPPITLFQDLLINGSSVGFDDEYSSCSINWTTYLLNYIVQVAAEYSTDTGTLNVILRQNQCDKSGPFELQVQAIWWSSTDTGTLNVILRQNQCDKSGPFELQVQAIWWSSTQFPSTKFHSQDIGQ